MSYCFVKELEIGGGTSLKFSGSLDTSSGRKRSNGFPTLAGDEDEDENFLSSLSGG